jgi:hypothetical protein
MLLLGGIIRIENAMCFFGKVNSKDQLQEHYYTCIIVNKGAQMTREPGL